MIQDPIQSLDDPKAPTLEEWEAIEAVDRKQDTTMSCEQYGDPMGLFCRVGIYLMSRWRRPNVRNR